MYIRIVYCCVKLSFVTLRRRHILVECATRNVRWSRKAYSAMDVACGYISTASICHWPLMQSLVWLNISIFFCLQCSTYRPTDGTYNFLAALARIAARAPDVAACAPDVASMRQAGNRRKVSVIFWAFTACHCCLCVFRLSEMLWLIMCLLSCYSATARRYCSSLCRWQLEQMATASFAQCH